MKQLSWGKLHHLQFLNTGIDASFFPAQALPGLLFYQAHFYSLIEMLILARQTADGHCVYLKPGHGWTRSALSRFIFSSLSFLRGAERSLTAKSLHFSTLFPACLSVSAAPKTLLARLDSLLLVLFHAGVKSKRMVSEQTNNLSLFTRGRDPSHVHDRSLKHEPHAQDPARQTL